MSNFTLFSESFQNASASYHSALNFPGYVPGVGSITGAIRIISGIAGALFSAIAALFAKFSDPEAEEIIGNSPTKLEINARDGIDGMDANTIKGKINRIIGTESNNYISEIEVFLPEGQGSILGIRGTNGLFDNWQIIP